RHARPLSARHDRAALARRRDGVHGRQLGRMPSARIRARAAARRLGRRARGREGGEARMTDAIFQPLHFRNLTVKNRIFRSHISGKFDNEDGSLSQTRINWECKFAKGGVGAIISSYVPVLMSGRIIAGYATIHDDAFIPFWKKLGEAVHQYEGCKYIMQLSHS